MIKIVLKSQELDDTRNCMQQQTTRQYLPQQLHNTGIMNEGVIQQNVTKTKANENEMKLKKNLLKYM